MIDSVEANTLQDVKYFVFCYSCGNPATVRDPTTAKITYRSWVDCPSCGLHEYRFVCSMQPEQTTEKQS